MAQQVPPRHRTVDVERIEGFRYPSPGSRPAARVPIRESDEVYDTKQFTRDPRNVPRDVSIVISPT